MSKLYWCDKCNENSVRRKVYVRKSDNNQMWVEHCINKGCGYRLSNNLTKQSENLWIVNKGESVLKLA